MFQRCIRGFLEEGEYRKAAQTVKDWKDWIHERHELAELHERIEEMEALQERAKYR